MHPVKSAVVTGKPADIHDGSAFSPQQMRQAGLCADESTVEDYTSDIEAVIEQLGLRNLVLWGASTGGRVAQMIAGLHPDWMSPVIVED